MLVLISYDVSTQDAAGRRRLRLIAKQCVNYGQRVQNSVFECLLDAAQLRALQAKKRTVCGSIISETAIRRELNTLAQSRDMTPRKP